MADIATLGLTVDSGGLRIATDRLDTLVATAGRAEKATGATARALDTLSGKARLAGGATGKAAAGTAGLSDAQDAAQARLLAEMQFRLDQLGRSTLDQAVAGAEHGKDLPVDLASANAQLIRTAEELKYARDLAGDFTSVLMNGLRGGESLWKSFGNAAIGVLNKIGDRLLDDVLNNLFGAVGGGGLLGSLIGALGDGSQFARAASGKIFGLFAGGGYTGPGNIGDPAGIVHRGEIVWSQQDIAQAGGVAAVEQMRLGRGGGRNRPTIAPVRPAGGDRTSIVVEGSQIVVQGNADRKTLAEMRRMLDERDRQITKTTGKTIDARNRTSQIRKTRA